MEHVDEHGLCEFVGEGKADMTGIGVSENYFSLGSRID